MSQDFTITVNGKPRQIALDCTLLRFLEDYQVNPLLVAVEYNGDIMRRERFAGIVLQPNDRLEIVHMVGGGA